MITIVSGLPRSGTSLMMQMLQLGGAAILTDRERGPDANNPRGYLEFEKVKKLKSDESWLPQAEGKVVKIISHLLYELPTDVNYKVIFMLRPVREVRSSQDSMLNRLGRKGAPVSPAQLEKIFSQHLKEIREWLKKHEKFEVLYVEYHDVLKDAHRQAQRINEFLGGGLALAKMITAVDETLYRERKME